MGNECSYLPRLCRLERTIHCEHHAGLYIKPNCPTPSSSSTLKIIRKSQQIANRTLDRSGLGAKISRPTKLTKSRSFSANTRRLVDLLASIPIVFPAEPISLTNMAVDAWGNIDSFAEAITSSHCNFSAIPDFQERPSHSVFFAIFALLLYIFRVSVRSKACCDLLNSMDCRLHRLLIYW